MKEEPRLVPVSMIERGPSGPDRLEVGRVLYVSPIATPVADHKEDLLSQRLRITSGNSVREIAHANGARIEGLVNTPEGKLVRIVIPIDDEKTCTPDGMTRKDRTLFSWYVRSEVYDLLSRYLSRNKRSHLTDQEVGRLHEILRLLAAARKEN